MTPPSLLSRTSSWLDWVRVVSKQLLGIIYRLGLTKERVFSWLEDFAAVHQKAAQPKPPIPEELKVLVEKALEASGMEAGFFVRELLKTLENPSPEFRWERNDLGQRRLVKVTNKTKNPSLAAGKRFLKKAWVGIWWYTDNPKTSAHIALRNLLKRNGGDIFYKIKSGAGVSEYFGYAIVGEDQAVSLGQALNDLAQELVSEEGPRDYRLSAASLRSLALHEPVKDSDTITESGIFKSQKFNWEYTLADVLNGRVRDQKLVAAVQALLKQA